jgi:hypothetical protein
MTFIDESAWRGKVHHGCWTRGWTRGDIARYPF